MSGFIANAPSSVSPSVQISSDPFWPSVAIEQVRARLRLDQSVTDARLVTAVSNAIATVNRELHQWSQTHIAQGHPTLDHVPDQMINGQPVRSFLYLRAIDGFVCAEINERYRSYDATRSGDQRADIEATTRDDYRRDARFAIRDFLGTPRITVDLL